jgi:predicted nucleotidyltransferase
MVKDRIVKTIKILKELLEQEGIRVDRIILFGSQSRNTSDSESDIDLAVISPDFEGKDVFERSELLANIQWELTQQIMMPFDIVAMSPKEWKDKDSLLVSFVRQGKTVAVNPKYSRV